VIMLYVFYKKEINKNENKYQRIIFLRLLSKDIPYRFNI